MRCDVCGMGDRYDVHTDKNDPRWHVFVYLRRDGTFYRKDLSTPRQRRRLRRGAA